ncbi:MAG: hypothetical protein CMP05_00180 [Xanthomarina sp.]|uniref:glycosyltransferase family 4 protein n=1 Tax=Xanthomarina sp. TaxID=1931211 RepID=UPI000C3AB745|nr:glycosyltransferase family 4 protein [Xanthomarina sp.]MAL23601.1 hypothetical protein [Xanthomarina sp.]MBF60401.1 hypothetical protein [Xanthomarina sp.]
MKKIKTIQLFENYNESYQPYIPPVLDALKASLMEVLIYAFKGGASTGITILPSYTKRRILQWLYNIRYSNQSRLDYVSIMAMRKQVDILHLQQSYLFPKIISLLSLPSKKRPKVIITLRGGDTYVKPWYSEKWFDFYTQYGNMVDAFIVMSEHQKEYLNRKWQIDKQRIHVIPISFGHAFDASVKQVDTKVMRIVSAFRMCWEKNIAGNLLAVKILKDRGIHVQYHLYGDGADSGQAYYLIDKYNLQDCVAYHGRLDNSELKAQLKRYDFYLQLSYSESLGMSVIEAQSQGIPAIVSNSDGLPEVVVHNQTGFCVAPHDSEAAATHLLQLWQNPDLYKQFSQEAIAFSHQHFSVETEVEALRRLYKSLIP